MTHMAHWQKVTFISATVTFKFVPPIENLFVRCQFLNDLNFLGFECSEGVKFKHNRYMTFYCFIFVTVHVKEHVRV